MGILYKGRFVFCLPLRLLVSLFGFVVAATELLQPRDCQVVN